MTRLVLSLAVFASTLLAGCQTMPATPNLPEVEAVERARFQTWIRGDAAGMNAALADDALYCHSNGQCQTKQELVAEVASRQRVYKKMDLLAMKPKVLGPDAVMINGTVDVVAELPGRVAQFRGIYTSVYVKRDGRWQLLSWQSTTLP
jgi:uncharacterized protein (TIGR02246 family)